MIFLIAKLSSPEAEHSFHYYLLLNFYSNKYNTHEAVLLGSIKHSDYQDYHGPYLVSVYSAESRNASWEGQGHHVVSEVIITAVQELLLGPLEGSRFTQACVGPTIA